MNKYEGMKSPQEIALEELDKEQVTKLIDQVELALKIKTNYMDYVKARNKVRDLQEILKQKDKEIQKLNWKIEDLKRKIRNYYR